MKLEEEFVGSRVQFAQFLKKVAAELEKDALYIRGSKVLMSEDDMEYKISCKSELGENKLSIKIEWMNNGGV